MWSLAIVPAGVPVLDLPSGRKVAPPHSGKEDETWATDGDLLVALKPLGVRCLVFAVNGHLQSAYDPGGNVKCRPREHSIAVPF